MYKLGRQLRLKTPHEYQVVFKKGLRLNHKCLILVVCKNEQIEPRIGFAISKKQVRKNTERNRIKRLAKEAFRLQQKKLQGIDFIVLVNKTCQHVENSQLTQYFQHLFTTSIKLLAR